MCYFELLETLPQQSYLRAGAPTGPDKNALVVPSVSRPGNVRARVRGDGVQTEQSQNDQDNQMREFITQLDP